MYQLHRWILHLLQQQHCVLNATLVLLFFYYFVSVATCKLWLDLVLLSRFTGDLKHWCLTVVFNISGVLHIACHNSPANRDFGDLDYMYGTQLSNNNQVRFLWQQGIRDS